MFRALDVAADAPEARVRSLPVSISFFVEAVHRFVLDLNHRHAAVAADDGEGIVMKGVRRNSHYAGVQLRQWAQQEPLPAVEKHALITAANADVASCNRTCRNMNQSIAEHRKGRHVKNLPFAEIMDTFHL